MLLMYVYGQCYNVIRMQLRRPESTHFWDKLYVPADRILIFFF
jgi:hypothetical protein